MNDIDQYVGDLEQNEGLPHDEYGAYGYLDSRTLVKMAGDRVPDPRVTFGIGCMVSSPQDMQRHPWFDTRGPQDGWDLSRMRYLAFEDIHLAGQTIPARKASYYQHKTTLRLPVEYCRQLCRDRLTNEFLPALYDACGFMGQGPRTWDHLPLAARRVLVDVCWTTGAASFAHEWPKLIAACKAGNWDRAAMNCHSAGMGEERWNWRMRSLRSIGAEAS